MQQGQIKTLLNGFGFITVGEGQNDVFFHARDLEEGLLFDDLQVGDALTFEMGQGDRGPKAINVQKAGAQASTDDADMPDESAPTESDDSEEDAPAAAAM